MKSRKLIFATLSLGMILIALAHLFVTPQAHDLDLWLALLGHQPSISPEFDPANLRQIFWDLRFPKTCAAVLVGFCLASAGTLTQGVFRNPLASPSLLGMTSIAAFSGLLTMHFAPISERAFLVPISAVGGCMIGAITLLSMHRRMQGQSATLLLAGYAVNAIFSSLSSFLLAIALQQDQRMSGMFFWLLGNIHIPDRLQLLSGGILAAGGALLCWRLIPKLDVLILGEEVASSLGLRIPLLQSQAILAISLFVAASLSVSGPIAFVGLMAPHMARKLVGAKHQQVWPAAAIVGMLLVLGADIAARSILYPHEVEVGIVLSLLGAPFFLFLLFRGQKNRN
jgi:iron complex transport system permease protein